MNESKRGDERLKRKRKRFEIIQFVSMSKSLFHAVFFFLLFVSSGAPL